MKEFLSNCGDLEKFGVPSSQGPMWAKSLNFPNCPDKVGYGLVPWRVRVVHSCKHSWLEQGGPGLS